MSELKTGDIVTIYHNALTSDKIEGQAKLIKKVADYDTTTAPYYEYWIVRFINENGQYVRLIKKP